MCVPEVCVAQTKTEREKGFSIIVNILPFPRWIDVVKVGQLPYAARKAYGKPARGIVVAEECFSDCLPSKLARVPGFQNGRHMFFGPRQSQGTTVLEHQDDRLAGRNDSLKQLLLVL